MGLTKRGELEGDWMKAVNKRNFPGTSLEAQWLKLCFHCRERGSIPGKELRSRMLCGFKKKLFFL